MCVHVWKVSRCAAGVLFQTSHVSLRFPSTDILRVPFLDPLTACSRLLRRGGEANGVCFRAPGLQGIRRWDAHSSRAHVPRNSPHVAPPADRTKRERQIPMPKRMKRKCKKVRKKERKKRLFEFKNKTSASLQSKTKFISHSCSVDVDPAADFYFETPYVLVTFFF